MALRTYHGLGTSQLQFFTDEEFDKAFWEDVTPIFIALSVAGYFVARWFADRRKKS